MHTGDQKKMELYHNRSFYGIFEPPLGMARLVTQTLMYEKENKNNQKKKYRGSEQSVRKGLAVIDDDKLKIDFCFYGHMAESIEQEEKNRQI